ncbi:MAG: hypothetical protein EA398_03040 [Deltaproteobacteria bacterium]|nr:MAG: hypothetical protein EA398_03040 [Deltaproteobacteria bacterium]
MPNVPILPLGRVAFAPTSRPLLPACGRTGESVVHAPWLSRPLLLPLAVLALWAAACDGSTDDAPPTEQVATWNATIGPFLADACGACHHPGGSGQFSLLEHEQAVAFGPASVVAIRDRRMPPWPADPDCRTFEHQRVVPPETLALLENWLADGAPVGGPVAEVFEPAALEEIRVDLTAAMPVAYTPPAAETDDYRCFLMDSLFEEDTWIEATQVLPGSPQVHHVLLYALSPEQVELAEAATAEEDTPGYPCFGGPLPSGADDGPANFTVPTQLGAWVPGVLPARLPADTALRIPRGHRIVMQVHYNTLTGNPEPDLTVFQMQLRDSPPQWLWRTRPLAQRDLRIEPGDPASEHTITVTNHTDTPVLLASVAAHMHTLGSAIRLDIQRADGSGECLMDIPRWDFDWQLFYDMPPENFARVEPGDAITLTCVYDNTPENQQIVAGERLEPRLVQWGDGTLDEMCLAYLGVISPWEEESDADGPCGAAAACANACDPFDTSCLLDCPGVDIDCLTCTLQRLVPCDPGCIPAFQAARECLQNCGMANVSLGSVIGRCMAAECDDAYAAMTACLDPVARSGACDDGLRACGIDP